MKWIEKTSRPVLAAIDSIKQIEDRLSGVEGWKMPDISGGFDSAQPDTVFIYWSTGFIGELILNICGKFASTFQRFQIFPPLIRFYQNGLDFRETDTGSIHGDFIFIKCMIRHLHLQFVLLSFQGFNLSRQRF